MKLVKLANNFYRVDAGRYEYYFSYETLIAVWHKSTEYGELVRTKFSATTSRHQNYVRDLYKYIVECDSIDPFMLP